MPCGCASWEGAWAGVLVRVFRADHGRQLALETQSVWNDLRDSHDKRRTDEQVVRVQTLEESLAQCLDLRCKAADCMVVLAA